MKWLADENLDNNILRGLIQRNGHFDALRVQDVGLLGKGDHEVLAWAGRHVRTLITHDLSTMIPALRAVNARQVPARALLVPDSLPLGLVIEQILLLDECSVDGDWAAGYLYLPLRG